MTDPTRTGSRINRRLFLRTAGLAAVGAGVGGGYALGTATVTAETATPNETDIGFCTDMAFHHEQAVAMCQRVLGRDTGGPVQASAAEILQNQSYERGLMHAWLQGWGESTAPPDEVMAWMGMATAAEEMPGLATDAEMAELADLDGTDKGRRFLELMRAHHVGGVHMAEAASGASSAGVRRVAEQMAATQTYEIAVFDQLLASTYAP